MRQDQRRELRVGIGLGLWLGLSVWASALASCAQKPRPAPIREARREAEPVFRPTLLTPRLRSLISALKAKGRLFRIRDELAKHIPGFAAADGKDLPEEATVEVLEVAARGVPLMAFVKVTPKGHVACNESAFAAHETKLFESKNPKVEFPRVAALVPVFEIHLDYRPSCPPTEETGSMVEVYHLASATRIGTYLIETEHHAPPARNETRTRLGWVSGRAPGTVYLVASSKTTHRMHPCSGVPEDKSAECRVRVECALKVEVVAVTPKGAEALEESQIRALRRRDPAFARVPKHAKGDSEGVCEDLTP